MTHTLNLTEIVNITDVFDVTDTNNSITTVVAPTCDDNPGFVSKETARKLKELSAMYASILGYVLCTICAVGVVTCLMAVIVLTRKNMKFSGSIILTWLAVAELMKSAIYLPYVVNSFLVLSRSRYEFPYSSPDKGWAIYHLSALIGATTCHNISIGLTISLAVFRCVYILFPNKAPKYCSPFRSKIAVIVTISCSLVINMPSYYIFTWYKDRLRGTDNYVIFARPGLDMIIYDIHDYITSIVMKFIPSALLIVLTMILIIAMNSVLKTWQKEERWITNLLLAVVLLFAFEESFHALLIILSKLVTCFEKIFYRAILPEVIETITFSTSIVNCMLYVSMSKRFRITFLNLFCPWCVLLDRPDRLVTNATIHNNPTGVSTYHQRDASSHLQLDAKSQGHGAELYGPDLDVIDIAIPVALHARGSDQHRISVDSTSV